MERARASGVITLLTDFGLSDSYVGQMKGVMLGIAPGVTLVDVTHGVPPQDILEGAFQLATAWRSFPDGTVHLAVVDPGVGSARRAIALQVDGHFFVLPDNGLCSLALEDRTPEAVVVLDPDPLGRHPSPTFHGRDVFAPAAALLARSARLEDVGEVVACGSVVRLDVPPVRTTPDSAQGRLISIDQFGNCRTLIRERQLPAGRGLVVRCNGLEIRGISRTYADVDEGQPLALIGSHGGLEISVRSGSAAERFGIQRGMMVQVVRREE